MRPDIDALREGLNAAFEEALRPLRAEGRPLTVLFSGGVDSALLAWELRRRSGVTLSTMGTERSADLRAGRDAATRLGLPWRSHVIGPADVRSVETDFATEVAGVPMVSRRVLLALALAIGGASDPFVVLGQGVDELFFGYAHYRGVSDAEAEQRSMEDMARLRQVDWPRTEAIARRLGKTAVAPYLVSGLEGAARSVPVDLRRNGEAPKQFFRDWAMARGLPPELAVRPKKALQYGSGVDALLRRSAGALR